jgi:hypothetical protein
MNGMLAQADSEAASAGDPIHALLHRLIFLLACNLIIHYLDVVARAHTSFGSAGFHEKFECCPPIRTISHRGYSGVRYERLQGSSRAVGSRFDCGGSRQPANSDGRRGRSDLLHQSKVLATNGQPVKGVTVTFTPAAESGTVTGGSQITDALGVATVTSWKLGTKSGVSTLNVSVQGCIPGNDHGDDERRCAAGIKAVSGENQVALVGAQLTASPQIRVVDSYDNGRGGATVSFSVANGGNDRAHERNDGCKRSRRVRVCGLWARNQATRF